MAVTRHARVGRRFRIASMVAFLILLPIAAWSAWDYVEARRWKWTVEEIQARGEPLTTRPFVSPARAELNAARYYAAASSLVFSYDIAPWPGLADSLAAGGLEADTALEAAREWLARHADAEALLAKATELEFLGNEHPLRNNFEPLSRLYLLADTRRLERLGAGDAHGAVLAMQRSLKAVRMAGRATELSAFALARPAMAIREIPALLALNPADEDLRLLLEAMAEVDRDELVAEACYTVRASVLGEVWDPQRQWYSTSRLAPPLPLRPIEAHRRLRDVHQLNELIAHARRPWPERLQVSGAETPWRYLYRHSVAQIATALAKVRVARAAVAVELYRRERGALPERLEDLTAYFDAFLIDPFSGGPLVYRVVEDGFVVYSLGPNQRDDHGDMPPPRRGPGGQIDSPPDIGLRVSLR